MTARDILHSAFPSRRLSRMSPAGRNIFLYASVPRIPEDARWFSKLIDRLFRKLFGTFFPLKLGGKRDAKVYTLSGRFVE